MWLVAVFVLWPAWYWVMHRVAVVPVVWFVNLVPSRADRAEGPFDRTQVVALAAVGFAFGFLGVYLLRLLRAPRLVWVPAAIMSVLIYLAGSGILGKLLGIRDGTGEHRLWFAVSILLGADDGIRGVAGLEDA